MLMVIRVLESTVILPVRPVAVLRRKLSLIIIRWECLQHTVIATPARRYTEDRMSAVVLKLVVGLETTAHTIQSLHVFVTSRTSGMRSRFISGWELAAS